MEKWINVKDRLPEIRSDEKLGLTSYVKSIEVIFTDGKKRYIGYATICQVGIKPKWYNSTGFNVDNVTHWAPLLELPNWDNEKV